MKYSVMSNAAWMMSEKVVSVFGVIFVTSYVAKSFGPSIFGQMAFSASLFSVIQTAAIFGTETLLFKHISKSAHKGIRLMNVAKKMRITILLLLSMPVLAWVGYSMTQNFLLFALASFISAVFVSQDTFSVYNNARLASRLNTVANSIGMLSGFAISFVIAWQRFEPLWLTLSVVSVTMLPYLIKRYAFYRDHNDSPVPVKNRALYIRYLLYAGLPLAISSIFISIQVKMAQFFLLGVGTEQDVGLFAAANTISASWIFIPVALITSSFSEIFRENPKTAQKLAGRLNGYVMAVSLVMLLFVCAFGEKIIVMLYGQHYLKSASLVSLLSVATCFSAVGTVAYRYIVKEGGFNYLLIKIVCLMLVAVPMSYAFIHRFGLNGAAWSVFATELLSMTIMNYFFKHGVIIKMQLSSFNYKTYK